MANLENILHLPTEESLNTALGEIATAIKNGGGGGGGAPAEHEHEIQDIYVPFATGGEWNTDGYNITETLKETLNNNDEAVEFMANHNMNISSLLERTVRVYSSEQPISDSEGNKYIVFMAVLNRLVLKTKLSPSGSTSVAKYGTIATLPADFDGEDVSGATISQSDKEIYISIGEHTYPIAPIESIEDGMALLTGQMLQDPSVAAAMLDKYGGSTTVLTVDMLGQDDQPLPDSFFTFENILNDEMLAGLFSVQFVGMVPLADIEDIISGVSEQEGKEMVKIHFDAVEDTDIQKKAVLDEVAKMIQAGKLNIVTPASEEAYNNLDYDVKHNPNNLFLIQED